MNTVEFPSYTGLRCLMMPYIQGDPSSVPNEYADYNKIIETLTIDPGVIGFLTIDESPVLAGNPHRGARAKHGRALHTEAGILRGSIGWGTPGWGGGRLHNVTLERDTQVLIASNVGGTTAVWDSEHTDTSEDGDIGYLADMYPYSSAKFLSENEVCQIGIFTPHESLPASKDTNRSFLRIVGSGVHGREPYFTINPLLST